MATDQRVIDLFVAGISEGLPHPDGKPRVLMNYRTSTMPAELANEVRAELTGLAEALEHQIVSNGYSIVPTARITELETLAAVTPRQPVETLEVVCGRPGCGCKEPLISITKVPGRARMTTDGPTFITAMSNREPACPHGPRR